MTIMPIKSPIQANKWNISKENTHDRALWIFQQISINQRQGFETKMDGIWRYMFF